MDTDHGFYMAEALKEAKLAYKKGEVPVGAVIVYNDEIIARTHNTRESSNRSIGHAEILCIEKANKKLNNWRLKDCIMYVTLSPCAMCAGAIREARIKTLVFGAFDKSRDDDALLYDILDNPRSNHRTIVLSGVLEDECSRLLQDFFKNKSV